ncbi:probable transporter MCH2 [Aspergillus udagawae]|uniref:Probable transporter MCH2 n=1 Tax=Aspergillus udagawae TaxID=91492 RepID=A0A8H3SCS1_9EURO|nr:probable transporter MCH2 [Aspergillus udagawae]
METSIRSEVIPQNLPLADLTRDRDQSEDDAFAPSSASRSVEAIPDGGYGWIVVFACFVQTFWVNAWSGSWGILQAGLIRTTMTDTPASTLSFAGSLGLALTVGLGLVCIRLAQLIGARWSTLIGILLFAISNIIGGFAVNNVGGMFVSGALYGFGGALMYTMSNILPVQWFNKRLGTANGLVKLGGGLGATVMAIVLQTLIERVGVAWTFHAMALMSLATGVPAAMLIKERVPTHTGPSVDFSLFQNSPFSCLFTAGAIAWIVACFNACMAIGRLSSGIACDKLGSTNTLLLAMGLNTLTMFAIWPVSSTLTLQLLFAAFNGLSNGAFFVTMPTAIARILGPGQASIGMGMAVTGWFIGDFLGSPIGGFLIQATGADHADSIGPYKPAIFYAAGTALVSTVFVLAARLKMDNSLCRKL